MHPPDVPLRVFVTVGNATVAFDRLLRIVDEAFLLAPVRVEGLCQVGVSTVRPRGLVVEAFLGRREYEAQMRQADVVITHAGIGTLHAARSAGHRPFVLPRRASEGEIVNDHQMEVYAELLGRGLIAAVGAPADLARDMVHHQRLDEVGSVSESDGEAIRSALTAGTIQTSPFRRAIVRAIAMGLSAADLFHRTEASRDLAKK